MSPHTMHTRAAPQTQQMLRPHPRRYISRPCVVEETTDAHRKLQRVRSLHAAHARIRGWLFALPWKTKDDLLRSLHSGNIHIDIIGALFHCGATSGVKEMLLHNPQLHSHEILQLLERAQLLTPETRRHHLTTPAHERGNCHLAIVQPLPRAQILTNAVEKICGRLSVARLPALSGTFSGHLQARPPRLQLPRERHGPELHPLPEDVSVYGIGVRCPRTTRTKIPCRALPHAHIQARSDHLRRRLQVTALKHRPSLCPDLRSLLGVKNFTMP